MKLIFTLILVVLTFTMGLAQREREATLFFSPAVSLRYPGYVSLNTYITSTIGRHMLSAGPGFPMNKSNPGIYELGCRYRFFMNREKCSVDPFVQYEFLFVRRNEFENSTLKGSSIHNRLGYGFVIFLAPGIFLTHSIGAGLSNAWFGDRNYTDISLSADVGILFNIRVKK